jgi:hypothetical protein
VCPTTFKEYYLGEKFIAGTYYPAQNHAAMSNEVAIVTDSTAYLPEES